MTVSSHPSPKQCCFFLIFTLLAFFAIIHCSTAAADSDTTKPDEKVNGSPFSHPIETQTIPKEILSQSPSFAERPKTLLITHPSLRHSHSRFIEILQKDSGADVELKYLSDVKRIEEYGEYLYDAIVILLPESERFTGVIKNKNLLKFMDSGRHLFIAAASHDVSDSVREMSSESALEFDYDKSRLHDYFHVGEVDGQVFTSQVNKAVIREGVSSPVLYKGMSMMETSVNPLIVPILRGEKTSFSNVVGDSLNETPNCMGEDCLLVAAIQGRNGARMTFVAGTDLLSDAFFDMPIPGHHNEKSSNADFTRQLMLWSLGMRGVLRYRNVQSHAEGESQGKHMYTVFEQVYYSVVIEEFDGIKKKWVPYVADDVQLEFIMLDPYYRLPLKYSPENGTYHTSFKIPDKYGVFKFSVDYRRQGYTPLVFETRQTVRPFRLDQYERFIPAAYPYYTSLFSLMIGFVFLSVMVLYSSYQREDKVKKVQ